MSAMHKTSTYRIVQKMKATGNQLGIIAQWKKMVEQWVIDNPTAPEAAGLRAWLPLWQARNHYSARELVSIWPVLALVLGVTTRMEHLKSSARLEYELDFARLPHFEKDGEKYYYVEQIHLYKNVTQGNYFAGEEP
jgi:hypothetical protein